MTGYWLNKDSLFITAAELSQSESIILTGADESTSVIFNLSLKDEPLSNSMSVNLNSVIAEQAAVNLQLNANAQVAEQIEISPVTDHIITPTGYAGWLTVSPKNTQLVVKQGETSLFNRLIQSQTNKQPEGSFVLSSPQNNSQYTEGELVHVRMLASGYQLDRFKYSRITLLDFNGNELLNLLSNTVEVDQSFKLPKVDRLDTYIIRVRSYFGDSYNFVERTSGIKVVPLRQKIAASIIGIADKAYVGSQVVLATSGQLTANIDVKNSSGALIASGIAPLTLIVPTTDKLLVNAYLEDGLGNQAQLTKTVLVDAPYSVTSINASTSF